MSCVEKVKTMGRAYGILFFFCFFCFSNLQAQESQKFEIRRLENIVYKVVDQQEIKLNLFLPERNGELLESVPLLIWIDSGCWYSDGPGTGGYWRTLKAEEQGFAIASVSHRSLGDGAVFPAQIEDVKAAVRYLRAHAAQYHLDPERFAVMGGSSGGHLSCMLGISDAHKEFDTGENLEYSSQVQRVVDFYGPTDFAAMDFAVDFVPECVFLAHGYDRNQAKAPQNRAALLEKMRTFSPSSYLDSNYAPILIFQGGKDQAVFCSQSCLFYDRLTCLGVPAKLVFSNTGVHDINSIGSTEELGRQIFEFLNWNP